MKAKTEYTEEPIGELKVIKDFLPSPDQLVLKEECENHSLPEEIERGIF